MQVDILPHGENMQANISPHIENVGKYAQHL